MEPLIRPIEEVAATLLHEMVHYFNYENGIQDCSRGNTYHNKKFKVAAEAHGLNVEHSDKYGWSHTAPGDALLDFILENGLTDILINRNEYGDFQITGTGRHSGKRTTPPPSPSSTRKYICHCCGNSVRATKTVNIACLDCNVQMVVVKSTSKNGGEQSPPILPHYRPILILLPSAPFICVSGEKLL